LLPVNSENLLGNIVFFKLDDTKLTDEVKEKGMLRHFIILLRLACIFFLGGDAMKNKDEKSQQLKNVSFLKLAYRTMPLLIEWVGGVPSLLLRQ
jgi:hypothetical protein